MKLFFAVFFAVAGLIFIGFGVYLKTLEIGAGGGALILAGAAFTYRHLRDKSSSG